MPRRRPARVERLLLRRALRVDDRLQRLVVARGFALGCSPRLLGMLGRNERNRLPEVANAVDSEHGLVAELDAVEFLAGTSSCVSTACTPGIMQGFRSVDRDGCDACACGLRSVWPHSIPAA